MRKPGAGAPEEVTWRSRLFTWGLLVLIPVPIVAYMAVAELFLGGVESARVEIVLGYVGVVLVLAWEYLREAWRDRREARTNLRRPQPNTPPEAPGL